MGVKKQIKDENVFALMHLIVECGEADNIYYYNLLKEIKGTITNIIDDIYLNVVDNNKYSIIYKDKSIFRYVKIINSDTLKCEHDCNFIYLYCTNNMILNSKYNKLIYHEIISVIEEEFNNKPIEEITLSYIFKLKKYIKHIININCWDTKSISYEKLLFSIEKQKLFKNNIEFGYIVSVLTYIYLLKYIGFRSSVFMDTIGSDLINKIKYNTKIY